MILKYVKVNGGGFLFGGWVLFSCGYYFGGLGEFGFCYYGFGFGLVFGLFVGAVKYFGFLDDVLMKELCLGKILGVIVKVNGKLVSGFEFVFVVFVKSCFDVVVKVGWLIRS